MGFWRKKACVSTFQGSDSSINCVKFLPGRLCILAAGSGDSSIRLYDLRAVKEFGNYKKDYSDNNSVNRIGFIKVKSYYLQVVMKIIYYIIEIYFGVIFLEVNILMIKEIVMRQIFKSMHYADKTKIAFINGDEIAIIK